jgi:hypothetical protein
VSTSLEQLWALRARNAARVEDLLDKCHDAAGWCFDGLTSKFHDQRDIQQCMAGARLTKVVLDGTVVLERGLEARVTEEQKPSQPPPT